jgi:hypothetical protein
MASSSMVSELDKRVSGTQDRLSKKRLQVHLNAVASPLCRLTFDVFSPILYEIFLNEQETLGPQSSRCLPELSYECLQVINVCTYVRRVAVDSPPLWSFISLNHRSDDWQQLCLARSAQRPLTISCMHNNRVRAPEVQKVQLTAQLPRA